MPLDPTNTIPVEDQSAPELAQQPDILSLINDDDLSTYILNKLKDDIRDREQFGWTFMRQYDQLAYDGYKDRTNDPWINASNYAVCMTPTLLDTGHSNTIGSIYAKEDELVSVRGIGQEDIRTAVHLKSLLNAQILNDIEDSYDVLDKTIHVAFKHGNACVKVIQTYSDKGKSKVSWNRIPIENIFLPVNAKGAQCNQSDHIFELGAWDDNDKHYRENLRDDQGNFVYENVKDLQKGNRIVQSTALQAITSTKDITGGTSLGERFSRDYYYYLESYLTYWFQEKGKGSDAPWQKAELIVWIAPMGGKILRKVLNTELDEDSGEYIRPYSLKWIPYPREDRIYGDSLPWIVKQSQEELDYAHNQAFNAVEKLINTPTFFDPDSGFDPEENNTVPEGWYPIREPNKSVFIPQYNYGAVFQHYKSFELFWEYAQRRTGFTELFQGRQQDSSRTLGEAEIRTNKTEVRFKTIYGRIEAAFAELVWLTYYYDKKYMPKDVKVKILGTADYKKVEELFPKGLGGRYNFRFSSEPITERNKRKSDVTLFYSQAVMTPIVQTNPVNQYNLLKMLANEAYDIRNIETFIQKPKGVDVLSSEESIQRVMSGQYDLQPDPAIDANDYKVKIEQFMRTDTFKESDGMTKMAIQRLLILAQAIHFAQLMGLEDAKVLQAKAQMEGQMAAQADGMNGNGSDPRMNGKKPNEIQ